MLRPERRCPAAPATVISPRHPPIIQRSSWRLVVVDTGVARHDDHRLHPVRAPHRRPGHAYPPAAVVRSGVHHGVLLGRATSAATARRSLVPGYRRGGLPGVPQLNLLGRDQFDHDDRGGALGEGVLPQRVEVKDVLIDPDRPGQPGGPPVKFAVEACCPDRVSTVTATVPRVTRHAAVVTVNSAVGARRSPRSRALSLSRPSCSARRRGAAACVPFRGHGGFRRSPRGRRGRCPAGSGRSAVSARTKPTPRTVVISGGAPSFRRICAIDRVHDVRHRLRHLVPAALDEVRPGDDLPDPVGQQFEHRELLRGQ